MAPVIVHKSHLFSRADARASVHKLEGAMLKTHLILGCTVVVEHV